ncbi:ATP-binding cassette domain-containing protein [Dactylosporangium sp. NPDC000521]|uniref:ATP-binding cassette domain-containing protein n=1 Tax=Dactylosporangium sp. NPDC000521 TaxID=3363975 RepID=UPI00368B1FFE
MNAVLEVADVVKEFPATKRAAAPLRAVDGVSFAVPAGSVFALVGESGSGKSTLARCVLGLTPVTAGTILVEGTDIAGVRGALPSALRRRVQIVFQNPYAALNPRMTVARLVGRPLRLIGVPRSRLRAATLGALDQVGLGATHLDLYPHELSGGQCQRIAIARALTLRPRLLVLDEPTSALDVSVQAQVLNLLGRLRAELDVAYLLISHDLAVVRHLADQVAVMRSGRLVETGEAATVLDAPQHPYTRSLLAAVPGRGRAALLADDPQPPAPAPSTPAPPQGVPL